MRTTLANLDRAHTHLKLLKSLNHIHRLSSTACAVQALTQTPSPLANTPEIIVHEHMKHGAKIDHACTRSTKIKWLR